MAKRKKEKVEKKEGIRHKPSIDIACRFCGEYANIPTEYRNVKNNCRYCKLGNREIEATSKACDQFDMCRVFRCPRWDFDTCPAICLNRTVKGFPECTGCKEGLMLYRYLAVPPPIFNIIGD